MKECMIVISAPSGTGKSTVIKELLKRDGKLLPAVSTTTRPVRKGEKEGVDYNFVDEKKFKAMAKSGAFVEWKNVHGHHYGTPKSEIERILEAGRDVLFDVDTEGAGDIKKKYPASCLIFLLPPSFEDLEKRLKGRATDPENEIEKRLKDAREEMTKRHEYDYQVVNADLNEAVSEIIEIVDFVRAGL